MDLDQILYGQQNNTLGNHFDNSFQNGNQHNMKTVQKADIFYNLNTQISDLHDTECFSPGKVFKLTGEDKVSSSQIGQIVQIAIQPYLEKIRQLEEIQQQKENQITALFYTIKKMDEIIKKIEAEQTKALATVKTTGGRKGAAGVSSTTAGGSAAVIQFQLGYIKVNKTCKNRSVSTTRSSANHSSLTQSAVINSAQGLQKKASVPSLLDSKRSGNSLSKSTLHEPTSSRGERGDRSERGESARSKINTPSSKGRERENGNLKKPVKTEKSKFDIESEQTIIKRKPEQVSNQNIFDSQSVQSNNQNVQAQQQESAIYNPFKVNPLQFINDFNSDTHQNDNMSQRSGIQEKEEQNNKHVFYSNVESKEEIL